MVQVSNMATTKWKSIPEYAAHLADLHAAMPSAGQLTKRLRSLRSPYTKTRILLPLRCKACQAVPAQTCPVVRQLPALNEWLHQLTTEIREVAPGKLALFGLKNDTRVRFESDTQREAVVLVHCLLTRHRCLQAAEGLHVLLPCYHKIFCDALRNSSSLTSLQLTKCRLTSPMVVSLVAALTSTDILEELSLDSCESPYSVRAAENALVSYIAKTKSLRSLSVVYVRLFRNTTALIQSLEKNTSIVRLALSSEVLLPEEGETFRRFLGGNSKILELSLVNDAFDGTVRLDKLFKAVGENSVLRKLSLRNFLLDLVSSVGFSDAVIRCPTLKEVELPYCRWKLLQVLPVDPGRELAMLRVAVSLRREYRVWPFVRALQNAPSLRKLTLDVGFTDWEVRKLFDAVRSNASLECLVLGSLAPQSMKQFCEALVETRTTEKVAFSLCRVPPTEFASALRDYGGTVRAGRYEFFDLSLEGLREIATAVALHDHITSLHLHLDSIEDDEIISEDASTIAAYLSSTATLKDIYLSFYVGEEVAHTLIEGIAKNSTLEKLGIEDWSVSCEDINVLCKWLAASRTLYHLVCLYDSGEASMELAEGLAEVLADSYTLTYLRLMEHPRTFHALQATRNMIRRNLALVECAVQFVLGSTEQRAARAFDLVSYHPQVSHKVREAASLTPADIKQKLKESRLRMHTHYWQFTGVIKNELICHKRNDGRMQIDQLGYDALLHVCSFLRVSDVLDEEKKEGKVRKRKRRGW